MPAPAQGTHAALRPDLFDWRWRAGSFKLTMNSKLVARLAQGDPQPWDVRAFGGSAALLSCSTSGTLDAVEMVSGNQVGHRTAAEPQEVERSHPRRQEPSRTAGGIAAGESVAGSMGLANFFTPSKPSRSAGTVGAGRPTQIRGVDILYAMV